MARPGTDSGFFFGNRPPPLAEAFDDDLGDAFDLETMRGVAKLITQPPQTHRQFAAINFGEEIDLIEHGRWLQRLPSFLGRIPSGVEDDEVGVQLRVECAGRVMPEDGCRNLSGRAFGTTPVFPKAGGGDALHLAHGHKTSRVVGLDHTVVTGHQRHDGNALRG